MTLLDTITAALRTAAAGLAAFIITFMLNKGWDFPDDVDAQINLGVFLGVLALWNFLVNLAASKIHPAFGYLLLIPKQPAYDPAKPIFVPDTPKDSGASAIEAVLIILVTVLIVLIALRLM